MNSIAIKLEAFYDSSYIYLLKQLKRNNTILNIKYIFIEKIRNFVSNSIAFHYFIIDAANLLYFY